jgi:RES domain-containing protein
MKLWRVSPARSLEDACRSSRAGRWSWASRDVLYTSSTPELAALEALAHRAENEATHFLCVIHLPDAATTRRAPRLPEDWRTQRTLTRGIGNVWFDRRASTALLVPSALCHEGTNVLVNPRHPRASGLRLEVLRRFDFDRRLLRGA